MATDVFATVGIAKSYESSDAVEWGLASLGLGAVTLLAAPITLVFNVLLWRSELAGGIPKVPAILAAGLGLVMMLGLAGCGVVFGLRGRWLDGALQRPSPTHTSEPTIDRTWLCRNERAEVTMLTASPLRMTSS